MLLLQDVVFTHHASPLWEQDFYSVWGDLTMLLPSTVSAQLGLKGLILGCSLEAYRTSAFVTV